MKKKVILGIVDVDVGPYVENEDYDHALWNKLLQKLKKIV